MKQTPKKNKMHIQSPCLLLNTCITVVLLKDRANNEQLGYARSTVYIDSISQKVWCLLQQPFSIGSLSSINSCIWGNRLNIVWKSNENNPYSTVPLVSIILIHSSRPITKFQHFSSTYVVLVEKLNYCQAYFPAVSRICFVTLLADCLNFNIFPCSWNFVFLEVFKFS